MGARFTFTIPVAQDAAIGAANLPVRSSRSERERERILAVDDDPQTLRHVRDALTNAGYAPVVTGDPEEALSLVEANDPHLVLLDLMLPGTDGIELMRNILDMADVPVIFLSVYGQEEIIARAFESGADDYVVKPFSADGACGEDQGGPAQAGSARMGRAVGTLRPGRPDHRLRRAPRDAGRASRAADRHRVRAALRAFGPTPVA